MRSQSINKAADQSTRRKTELADAGLSLYNPSKTVNTRFHLIQQTGVFTDQYKTYEEKISSEKI